MPKKWLMRRGSTPLQHFKTKIDLTDKTVYVTYSQDDQVIVEKEKRDLLITSDHVYVMLTQEDTLKFKTGRTKVQFRYIDEDGHSCPSKVLKFDVTEVLKEGVIEFVRE